MLSIAPTWSSFSFRLRT